MTWTSSAFSCNDSYTKYKIKITENSTDVADNTSNVTVAVVFYRTAGYAYGTGTVHCTINGTKYSSSVTSSQKITTSEITLFKKTLNIKHNTDGTKTLSVSAYIDHNVVSSSSHSYSHALTTIARSSSMSVSNGTLGTAQTISVTRQSSSYSHTITYKCGTASGTVVTKSTSTNISFTPPLTLASQNTTGTSVSITYSLQTFNGSTAIGGAVTKTVTCSIPSSVKPSCTLTLSDPTGYADIFGGYVQNKSKLKTVINPTTVYDSAIATYIATYNGSESYTTKTSTSEVIEGTTMSVTAKVTDKRGRSGSATDSVTVLPYESPRINELKVNRCDASGNVDQQGQYCLVTYSHNITALSDLNDKAVKLSYKRTSDTEWTDVALSSEYTSDGATYIFSASDDATFEIKLSITDHFETTDRTVRLSTAYTLMHFGANGKGLAIGKICEGDGLDVGMDAIFRGQAEHKQFPVLPDKLFKRFNADYPEALTIDANGSTGAITLDITELIPDGYVPVMVNVLDIPTANLLIPRLYINDSGAIVFRCKNGSTTGASITANANTIRFKVLSVRGDYI